MTPNLQLLDSTSATDPCCRFVASSEVALLAIWRYWALPSTALPCGRRVSGDCGCRQKEVPNRCILQCSSISNSALTSAVVVSEGSTLICSKCLECAVSYTPVLESLGRRWFMVRSNPTNLPKFLSYHHVYSRGQGPSSVL
jgi:hypothetical protein